MSNRFHSKFHRQNHHTYTSGTNPDAGHDPIASREQPFRGDFVLSGALSCSAPTSAVAGYFFTNNTALCAIAGFRGIYVRTPVIAGEFLSTAGDSISAYGALNGGDFYAGLRGVRARGNNIGVDAYSPNIALNASGVNIGTYTYSPKVALSTNSPLTGASISGDSISLLTVGNGVNILKNRTGIQKTPNASYPAYSLTNIVLDVNGDLLVDGNTLITGNLSALGTWTQIDTNIQITSSLRVNNIGTQPAATIVQTGNYPILACYDNEISLSVPSFIVDGGTNGWVALGTATPTAPFTIQKSRASNQGNNQPQVRITDNGTTNKVSISTPITNFDRSYIGTESDTSFDIVTNSASRITVLNDGNVGIGDTTPTAKLTVNGGVLTDSLSSRTMLTNDLSSRSISAQSILTDSLSSRTMLTGDLSSRSISAQSILTDSLSSRSVLTDILSSTTIFTTGSGNVIIDGGNYKTNGNNIIIGTNSNQHLRFRSGGSTSNEIRMTILSGGDVGIGTSLTQTNQNFEITQVSNGSFSNTTGMSFNGFDWYGGTVPNWLGSTDAIYTIYFDGTRYYRNLNAGPTSILIPIRQSLGKIPVKSNIELKFEQPSVPVFSTYTLSAAIISTPDPGVGATFTVFASGAFDSIGSHKLSALNVPAGTTVSVAFWGKGPLTNISAYAQKVEPCLTINGSVSTSFINTSRFEVKDGFVIFSNLPTASTGLPSGAVWRDGTVLKVVA